mgnify:CR=1 FL=1
MGVAFNLSLIVSMMEFLRKFTHEEISKEKKSDEHAKKDPQRKRFSWHLMSYLAMKSIIMNPEK